MSVVFDEVVGNVAPPEPAQPEEAHGGQAAEEHQSEHLRQEIEKLTQRMARLCAD